MQKNNVLIIYTGGTIGMAKTPNGLAPSEGILEKFIAEFQESQNNSLPNTAIISFSPLIDSSNVKINDWNHIGKIIIENYNKYDGFLIVNGTDTMAYSASALSFMFDNLNKPIIFTGSQLNIKEKNSDGSENLLGALRLAGELKVGNVYLYFNYKLLQGNRSTKVSINSFDAFASPNHQELIIRKLKEQQNNTKNLVQPKLQEYKNSEIIVFSLIPGFTAKTAEKLLIGNPSAVIMRCFGTGNAPHLDKDLMDVFYEAHRRGVILVGISQCPKGQTSFSQYEAGSELAKAGFISAGDMTLEATVTKLYHLFSKNLTMAEIERYIAIDIKGELTSGNSKQ